MSAQGVASKCASPEPEKQGLLLHHNTYSWSLLSKSEDLSSLLNGVRNHQSHQHLPQPSEVSRPVLWRPLRDIKGPGGTGERLSSNMGP